MLRPGILFALFALVGPATWAQVEGSASVEQQDSGAGAPNHKPEDDGVIRPQETKHPTPLARKLTQNFVSDQKAIWTSPFHTRREDIKWWALLGAGTAALIATDSRTSRQLPNTAEQIAVSRHFSQIGATYTTFPIAGGLYLVGHLAGNPKARETGVLGVEALLDSYALVAALKTVTGRQRPLEGDGNGQFFKGGRGFPSGHAMLSWSFASVIAHEYRYGKVVPIITYSLSSIISASRFSARKHFASDVVAGAAMGWLIGRHVFKTHYDPDIHRRGESEKARLVPRMAPYYSAGRGAYGVSLNWDL